MISPTIDTTSTLPSPAAWRRFLATTTLGLGTSLMLAGVVYFFARNWHHLGRFGKFALIETGIIVCIAVALRAWSARRPVQPTSQPSTQLPAQLAVTAAAVLVGVWLVVQGQAYQLGADPSLLYWAWLALALPWVVAARFAPLWCLEFLLANVVLALTWREHGQLNEPLQAVPVLLSFALLNGLLWQVWERLSPSRDWMTGRWLPRLLVLAMWIPVVIAALLCILLIGRDDVAAHGYVELALSTVAVLAGWWLTLRGFRQDRDLFGMAVMAAGAIALVTGALSRLLFLEDGLRLPDSLRNLMMAVALVLEAGLAVRWLERLRLGSATAAEPVQAPDVGGETDGNASDAAQPDQSDQVAQPVESDVVVQTVEPAPPAQPAPPAKGPPWYVRLVATVAAWIAAAFLSGFVAVVLGNSLNSAGVLVLGLLVAVAAIVMERRFTSIFVQQLAVAFSILARILVAIGAQATWEALGRPGGQAQFDAVHASAMALVGLELIYLLAYRDAVGRYLAAALVGAWLIVLTHDAGLPYTREVIVLVALAALVALWWPSRGQDAGAAFLRDARRPFGYGLATFASITLLVAEWWGDLMSFEGNTQHTVLGSVATVGIALLLALVATRLIDRRNVGRLVAALGTIALLALVGWHEPGVLLAILLLVLGFAAFERPMIGLATLFLIFFGWHFYYSLSLNFLQKALVLWLSGLVLLAAYAWLVRSAPTRSSIAQPDASEVGTYTPDGFAWATPTRLLVVGLALVLLVGNGLALGKEVALAGGQTVFLELAPLDPRAFLFGDYMALDYTLNRDISNVSTADWPDKGLVVASLDKQRVAHFVRRQTADGAPLEPDELLLSYRTKDGGVQVGRDAWYFEEGEGETFAPAKYGEYLVSKDGVTMLVALRDEALQPLGRPLSPWWNGQPSSRPGGKPDED